VSQLDHRWNTILPNLISLAEKLEGLGFSYSDGKVIVCDLDDKNNV